MSLVSFLRTSLGFILLQHTLMIPSFGMDHQQGLASPGFPQFQLQAYPTSGVRPQIEVDILIPYSSVIFVRSDAGYVGTVAIDVILTVAGQEAVRAEEALRETLLVSTYEQTQERRTKHVHREIPIASGDYQLRVSLTDLESGKITAKTKTLVVKEIGSEGPYFGEMRLRVREEGRYLPFVGLQLTESADSVECSVTLENLMPGDSMRLAILLQRLGSDSSIPVPPYAFNPSHGSLDYGGIDTNRDSTVFSQEMIVSCDSVSEQVTSTLFVPEPGVYKVVVRGSSTGRGKEAAMESSRYVAIMPRGFPRPTELNDLLGPIAYLLDQETIDTVTAKEARERRQWFEQFWLSKARSQQQASVLIRQFSERVEEANIFFSSFVEGWRTDRGMIYIVLGPPLVVETGSGFEVWRYSLDDENLPGKYIFHRVQFEVTEIPFEHFVLERQAYYDQSWLAAVDRWRRGAGY